MKYIPQDKAIATVESIYKVVDEKHKIDWYRDILKQCFEDFPFDYDIVKVVRCRDCKHHGSDRFEHSFCNLAELCDIVDEDHYCGYGERKIDEVEE